MQLSLVSFKQSPREGNPSQTEKYNNTSAITKQLNHYLRQMTKANEAMVLIYFDIERFVSNYENRNKHTS